ncbi:MAG TPA: hypothetical protein VHH73_14205 [Verrucomicrobiae bacterium]|nr:hypothetical protein [Verrucomicrobiae bacterium]
MITFDAFLVFLVAAALPVIYLFLLRRWLEPEWSAVNPPEPVQKAAASAPNLTPKLV